VALSKGPTSSHLGLDRLGFFLAGSRRAAVDERGLWPFVHPVERSRKLDLVKSACLNCAEGAGRFARADKARAFTIARGECVEAAAAIEIAAACGYASTLDVERVAVLADRLVAMLTRLIR
jgi:hypothetical protein